MTKTKKSNTPKILAAKPLKEFTVLTVLLEGDKGSGKTAFIETVLKPALAQSGIGVLAKKVGGDSIEGLRLAVPTGHFKAWEKAQSKLPLPTISLGCTATEIAKQYAAVAIGPVSRIGGRNG